MATQAEFEAALANAAQLTDDLAKWFNIVGADLQKMSDPRAARVNAMCVGGSKAAKRMGAALLSLSSIQNEITESGIPGVHTGVDSVTDSGPDDPVNVSTGEVATWVTSDTLIFGYVDSGAIISDPASAFWYITPGPVVPGVGFQFTVKNATAPAGSAYTVPIKWFAFEPG